MDRKGLNGRTVLMNWRVDKLTLLLSWMEYLNTFNLHFTNQITDRESFTITIIEINIFIIVTCRISTSRNNETSNYKRITFRNDLESFKYRNIVLNQMDNIYLLEKFN